VRTNRREILLRCGLPASPFPEVDGRWSQADGRRPDRSMAAESLISRPAATKGRFRRLAVRAAIEEEGHDRLFLR